MQIRNFCIIAHIDHGKSTIADRMLELTGTVLKRDMKHAQTLDMMDIEQERGITIKLTPVRMNWKGFQLNLIDTPGHVDFQYEVSRSLASVEGAILVVDASQGIEAQTLSNVYLAIENNLTIIPVLNKIDLPSADIEGSSNEIISLLGCKREDILKVSAKTGEGIENLLDEVVTKIPLPKKLDINSNLVSDLNVNITGVTKGLIFDSQYDIYKGVVIYLKLFSGEIKKGDKIEFLHTGVKVDVLEVGYFAPKYNLSNVLKEGEIGYVVTGLKSISEARVGDTVFVGKEEYKKPIKGFKKILPFIFAGIYPVDSDEYNKLKDSLNKLSLNDSSISIENESSPALGYGFRCGFLGLLHLDIVKERLWREFQIDVIITSPQVTYKVLLFGNKTEQYCKFKSEIIDYAGKQATCLYISNPEDFPKPGTFIQVEEPIAKVEIITPVDFVGNLMQLAQERRGVYINQFFIDTKRVVLVYEIPLAEIISDFYDDLKSLSSGYASLNYEFVKYKSDNLVKLDILVAHDRLDALSNIVHSDKARNIGIKICKKLKDNIPKAQFSIAIQAAIGAQVIARETIPPLRKDVIAKLYGGDVTRKNKLLDKQKEGKKKMRQFGKVNIPSETFINILKKD